MRKLLLVLAVLSTPLAHAAPTYDQARTMLDVFKAQKVQLERNFARSMCRKERDREVCEASAMKFLESYESVVLGIDKLERKVK